MQNEVWKDCKYYEGLYLISNYGRIIDLSTKRYSTCRMNDDGRTTVLMRRRNGEISTEYTDRLVGLTFLEYDPTLKYIQHINGVRCDNHVDNLRWVEHKS